MGLEPLPMYATIIIMPLVIVLLLLTYGVIRSIVRLWLDHRVKVALLERIEKHPELVHSDEELQDLIDGNSSSPEEPKLDYVLTGVILAVIGLAFVLFNGMVGRSMWATGAYFGGVTCVAIGFILVVVGLVLRFLSQRSLAPRPSERTGWRRLAFWR